MTVGDEGLARLLLDALRAVEADVAQTLRDRSAELTPRQAAALLFLDRNGTRLTELATRAAVTKQAMMQLVDDLEAQGSVRRRADADDARAKVVQMTPKGMRQRAEARRVLTSTENRIRRRLGERRYEALRVTLEELAAGEGP